MLIMQRIDLCVKWSKKPPGDKRLTYGLIILIILLDTLNSIIYNVHISEHMFNNLNIRRKEKMRMEVDEYLEEGDFRNEECKDSFMWIYDRMPPKMKMVVDLSMTGSSVEDIARLLKVSVHTIMEHKRRAKKRLYKLF